MKIHKYKLDNRFKSTIDNILSKVCLAYSEALEEGERVFGYLDIDHRSVVSLNTNTYNKLAKELIAFSGTVPHTSTGLGFKIKNHSNDRHGSGIFYASNKIRFECIVEESIPDDEFYVYINVEKEYVS